MKTVDIFEETSEKPSSNQPIKNRRERLFDALSCVLDLSMKKIHSRGNSDSAKASWSRVLISACQCYGSLLKDAADEYLEIRLAVLEEAIEVKGKGKMKMYFIENTNTTTKYSITHNTRSSARIFINTEVQIDIGSNSYHCEAVDVSTDGGALLLVKNKIIDKTTLDKIEENISIVLIFNTKDRIDGKLVRYFKKEDKLYFGIQY